MAAIGPSPCRGVDVEGAAPARSRRCMVFATLIALAAPAYAALAADPPTAGGVPMDSPTINKASAIAVVERIEPVVGFWQRLGVAKVMEVPEGEGDEARIGFAIFAGPGIEVMYQTASSLQADLVASSAPAHRGAFRPGRQQAYWFVEVGSLAEVERRLEGERQVMPHRVTFYGAKELAYDDRAGNIVVFAEMPPR